ncbi:hypothetical protein CPB83DRAFT_901584 [Crepidotus variabilis]|uniref:TRP C-terminal domain-containing protein n=1 Tax=Crepidotus variabilis TaxID=179855 RepID=A0A9P6ET01_9AGAR|nr:hypothetical protein CPB83DRAFT_901584 [Crepidotus variabilis]
MRNALISLAFSLCVGSVFGNPASLAFQDCFDDPTSESQRLQVDNVYAQVLQNNQMGHYLNLTVLGSSPRDILGLSNTSTSLSTLFTTTSVLTLNAWSNSSYLCQNMRPPSPLPQPSTLDNSYCPIAAGPFAFSSTIPWGGNRELTTLTTRLRAVDPFGKLLLCLDVATTPLDSRPKSPYGKANIIFWSTVALAISYWVVVGLARIASAWNRGISRPGRSFWGRMQSAGYILASSISGERFNTSPALLRFCTPSLRDVIFHTQWCAVLAMVAVEWPQFVYPLLTQTAWATLVYNVTLTHDAENYHWDPMNSTTFSPPDHYKDQIFDPNSPLFIDTSQANSIFTLPPDAKPGISSFAYTLGIRPQDLFPICLILFLSLAAVIIAISFLLWLIDYTIASAISSNGGGNHPSGLGRMARARSPTLNKELETPTIGQFDENKSLTGHSSMGPNPKARFALAGTSSNTQGISSHRAWWKLRTDIGAFHGSVLHGNLVRLLVLFHLPVTVFSCYQMTLPTTVAGTTSVVLAALSFVAFSVLIPLHLVIRVTFTTTNKLYDQTKTLLSLGPLYNHYRHGSQLFAILFFATNIAFGITVGAGQKSGTAQAVVILVVEVISALVTSIWLPWGSGASMGLISFLFCVARIVIAVLVVILTQAISIGAGPGGWIAYGILIILALVYLALLLMLLVKIVEGFIRLFGGAGFDKSKRSIDSGFLGALGLLGCCGHRRRRSRRSTGRRSGIRVQQTDSKSEISYSPPIGDVKGAGSITPHFLQNESRMGSVSSQPRDVLTPEQANRPYREDSDGEDEGFIMGAWQKPPKPSGYVPVTDSPLTSPPGNINAGYRQPTTSMSSGPSIPAAPPSTGGASSSGFSRVGGGRAHIDTPYAIQGVASGSTHTFPSISHQSQIFPNGANQSHSTLQPPSHPLGYGQSYNQSHEDVPLSFSNVETGVAVGSNGLPVGAMQPAHIRTKSQTAIVENFHQPMSAAVMNMTPSSSMNRMSVPPAVGSSASMAGLSARQKYLSQDFLRLPDSAPSAQSKFTLGGDDNGDEDSGDEDQDHPKKKRWYQLRRSRAHSNEGRTSTSPSSTDLASFNQKVDEEMGVLGSSAAASTPQRSFVVVRKQPTSVGRAAGAKAEGSSTYPSASSRPPTR